MKRQLPDCMRYAGWLGHEWVVTVMGDTGERLYAQCNKGQQAARAFDQYGDKAVSIYRRNGRGWKRITRSAAVLDGEGGL